jgi:hypothetical protein
MDKQVLYRVRHNETGLYFRPRRRGYQSNLHSVGKFYPTKPDLVAVIEKVDKIRGLEGSEYKADHLDFVVERCEIVITE